MIMISCLVGREGGREGECWVIPLGEKEVSKDMMMRMKINK